MINRAIIAKLSFSSIILVAFCVLVFLPQTTVAATFTHALIQGDSGADITTLQQILFDQGFLHTTPTGYFGALTAKAVADFQTAHNIDPLGGVGPLTRAILNTLASSSASSTTSSCTPLVITRILDLGSTGRDVTALQTFLVAQGYLNATPTGYFGNLTHAAVAKFQTFYGFEPIGGVGPLTRAKVAAVSSVCTASTSPITTGAAPTATSTPSTATTTPPAIIYGGGGGGGSGGGGGGGGGTPSDTTPPNAPTNLSAVVASSTEIDLSWTASTDNVAVANYEVFRNGALVSSPSGTTYQDSGLLSATPYTYYIEAVDTSNNISASSTSATATTTGADITPPTVSITAPTAGSIISGSSVTLTATSSDNIAVTGVQFKIDGVNTGASGNTSPYSTSWNSTGVVDGSHTISSVARDAAGNLATSSLTVTVDNTPPVISGIASSTGSNFANITWTTNENSNSKVVYGLTTAYGFASSSPSLVASHSISISGLAATSTYHYAVVSTDAAGNTSTSSDQTFTTAMSAPVISNISSGTPTTTSATITWTTDQSSNSKVVWGTTTSYGSASSSPGSVTSHSISLAGLATSTTYHFAAVSTNGSSQTSTSTDQTFTTASGGGGSLANFTWQAINIGAGGFLDGMDVAPDGTMVLRTDTYGAYIWDGAQWQQLVASTTMPAAFVSANGGGYYASQGVFEIQIAPSNSSVMYMMYDGYLFKTTNKGTTWTQTPFTQVTENANGNYRMYGQKIAINPSDPNTAYAGTPLNGLFVTTNGGTNWTSVSSSSVPVGQTDGNGDSLGITGILFNPASTSTVYAASAGNGVYKTTNAGGSWTHLSGSPANVHYAAITTTGVYYAVDSSGNLWRYNGSWTEMLSDGLTTAVASDPNNANHVVAIESSGALNESLNGGTAWSGWSEVSNNSADIPWINHLDPYAVSSVGLFFSPTVPGELLTHGNRDFWTTTLSGNITTGTTVAWASQGVGIEQLVANQIIVPPGGVPLAGAWDTAVFYLSDPTKYQSSYGPVEDPQITAGWSLDYAATSTGFVAGIFDGAYTGTTDERSGYSTNYGQTWTAFPSYPSGFGTGGAFSGPWAGSIAVSSPTNILWAPSNYNQPYYTTDGGNTWNAVSLPGVSSWSSFGASYYADNRYVATDRVLPDTFYLADNTHGLYKTTNGGATWTQIYAASATSGPFYYPNAGEYLQSVPGEAGNLFYSGGQASEFDRSTDGGATWNAVPNVTGAVFGFGAAAPGQSYPAMYIAGTVNGVYGIWQSINDAQSWTQIGTFPNNDIDGVKTITGNPNVYGQVYLGFSGSGFAYFSTNGPSIRGISMPLSSQLYGANSTITLGLAMSEPVTVSGGTPTLSLNDGGTATYASGSGTDSLLFSYTVGSGQSTSSLAINSVNANGATIVDTGGNIANLSISGLSQSGPRITGAAPVLSSIASTTAATSATVTWTTDENSTSEVVYGATTSYGSASSSASLVTSHSITISGLATSTTYHYEVVSTNGAGQTSTSTDQTFTTFSGTYDSATLAWVSAVTTAGGTVSTAQKGYVNTLITCYKSAGVFSLMDREWLLWSDNEHQAQIDIINDQSWTSYGTDGFTPDAGYTGDGSASYLDTNFDAFTAGGNYSQNSASIDAYITRQGSEQNPDLNAQSASMFGTGGPYSYVSNDHYGDFGYGLNDSNFLSLSGTSPLGLFSVFRTSSSTVDIYHNGALATSSADQVYTFGTVPNTDFYIEAGLTSTSTVGQFNNDTLGMVGIGGGLTTTQAAAKASCDNAYAMAKGFNVF